MGDEPWPIIPGRILSEIFCCGKIGDDKDEALKTAFWVPIITFSWGALVKGILVALRDYDRMCWTESWQKRDISEMFQESYFSSIVLMGVTCCACLVGNYSHYKLNQLHGYIYYSKSTEAFLGLSGCCGCSFPTWVNLYDPTWEMEWSLFPPHAVCCWMFRKLRTILRRYSDFPDQELPMQHISSEKHVEALQAEKPPAASASVV